MRKLINTFLVVAVFSSCVSQQKFTEMEESRKAAQLSSEKLTMQLESCNDQKMDLEQSLRTKSSELKNKDS